MIILLCLQLSDDAAHHGVVRLTVFLIYHQLRDEVTQSIPEETIQDVQLCYNSMMAGKAWYTSVIRKVTRPET